MADSGTPRPKQGVRPKMACARCQKRKIKCNGSTPKCSACEKAGAECVSGKRADGSISKTEAQEMQRQIKRLKTYIQAKGLNIDAENPGADSSVAPLESSHSARSSVRSFFSPPPISLNDENDIEEPDRSIYQGTERTSRNPEQTQSQMAHEIGLVSVTTGADPQYVGPSSGYSFAKLLLAHASLRSTSRAKMKSGPNVSSFGDVFWTVPTPPPPTLEHATKLSEVYFDLVHPQYPFLHRSSFYRLLEKTYQTDNVDKISSFQVNMVLAISATILARRVKIPFSGEGLCASAMKLYDEIPIQQSLRGLQCLLLVVMFTLHSPFLGMNAWHLNYQCLAAVLELGLQRDVRSNTAITSLEQEIRTRVFWVIYVLDRTLATTMGRPIGLRDEACDLRLPSVSPPEAYMSDIIPNSSPNPLSCATHLFKLAQMNSEVKYLLHSISHKTPLYCYPNIPDILQWQSGFLERLDGLFQEIPQFDDDQKHWTIMCHIRYYEIVMLALRPTPRIRTPSKESLIKCHASAVASLKLWSELYEAEKLSYSWLTIHSISLTAITMLYCIWTVAEIAQSIKAETVMGCLRAASNILTATSEHWPEAKRSRKILDEISSATIRWLMDNNKNHRGTVRRPPIRATSTTVPNLSSRTESGVPDHSPPPYGSGAETDLPQGLLTPSLPEMDWSTFDTYIDSEDFASLLGAPQYYSNDIQSTMQGMFSDFQPTFDFEQMDFEDTSLAF